jgi:small subunit ribosomal protein S6
MRNYELLVVIQPDLEEAAITDVNTKIEGWISEAGGKVEKTDNWGKRRLAYEINKQRDGIYILYKLTMPPTYTTELERRLRFLEPVMRHMVTIEA